MIFSMIQRVKERLCFLENYNCGTMTQRSANVEILTEDTLVIHPDDAAGKGIGDDDWVRLFSARSQMRLRARVSDEVNRGILYTTFHFPEHMINRETSDVADEESLCPEYKVAAVDFERSG